MNTKTKTAGLLGCTLITGLILGAFLHSLFIRQTINRMSHKWRSPDFFIERFDDLLQPTVEQREKIEKILLKHHQEMMHLRELMPARFDSLKKELDAVLTPEQRLKLEKHYRHMNRDRRLPPMHHRMKGLHDNSRNHPPPPPDNPI